MYRHDLYIALKFVRLGSAYVTKTADFIEHG